MFDELKPCPFCGGEAHLFVGDGVRVICPSCGAGTKTLVDSMGARGVAGNATAAVIEAWNKRPKIYRQKIDNTSIGPRCLDLNVLRDEIYADAIAHGLFEEFDQIKDPVRRRRKLAMRIMEEAAEMYAASDDPEHYAEEAADVTLMTGDVCGYLGIDWHGAVMAKKEINKGRPWKHGKE